jgi:D-alanyl-D-alanine carboxypeptidase (penicillin-binding protein 5/6)
MRIVSVVLGANSNRRRFTESAGLLDKAFADWNRIQVIEKGQDLGSLAVHKGTSGSVRLLAANDVCVLIPSCRKADLRVAVSSPSSIPAPVAEGWKLGSAQIFLGDSVAAECSVVAQETVGRANPVERLLRSWID